MEKQFNIEDGIEYRRLHDGALIDSFGGAVADEIRKCKITTKLETKPHQFSDGEADICKKLTIEIDFGTAVVQPHTEIEDDFGYAVTEALEQNINGLFENQLDESAD